MIMVFLTSRIFSRRRYGGGGLDFFSRIILSEEIAKHRQGLYNPGGGAFGGNVNPLLYLGNEEQKERYLKPCVRGEKRGWKRL
jgi:alkylation response protein AidB-like acyl-CoA dehydrogenase